MWAVLLALIPEIFRLVREMLKRQWGLKKQPLQIISKQNAMEELRAMRNHLDKVMADLEKSR